MCLLNSGFRGMESLFLPHFIAGFPLLKRADLNGINKHFGEQNKNQYRAEHGHSALLMSGVASHGAPAIFSGPGFLPPTVYSFADHINHP